MIGLANQSFSGWLPADGAAQIYDPNRAIAGSAVPIGVSMEPAPGGFRVSGTWRFASGIPHRDWAAGFVDGGLADTPGGGQRPVVWLVHFPPDSFQVDED